MPPGRLPKHPSVRQRTNKVSTRATLRVLTPAEIEAKEIPALPKLYDKDGSEKLWSDRTLDWWVTIWLSPMAPEFHDSDTEGLYRLAALVEAFWRRPSKELNAEIRLYETQFGLNPLSRRRLEWQIEDTEKAQDAGEDRRTRRASRPTGARRGGSTDPLSA
jgi:hypothetical protein